MDESMLFVISVVLAVVLRGGFVFFKDLAAKKRREALVQVARELGLPFNPQGDPSLRDTHTSFRLFHQGYDRNIKNLMQGTYRWVNLAVFDFSYVSGSGKKERTVSQTVASLASDRLNLPDFSLAPESVWTKMSSVLGQKDINFEENKTFSKKYTLRGSDEAAVRMLFSPRLLTFFENAPGWCVDGNGTRLLVYHQHKNVKPQEMRQFVEDAYAILALFNS